CGAKSKIVPDPGWSFAFLVRQAVASCFWSDAFGFWKKIADGRAAIAHHGPGDVCRNGRWSEGEGVLPTCSATGRSPITPVTIDGVPPRDIYAIRRKQANLPARAGGQGVNVKIGKRCVGRAHYRRWRGDDLQFAARADPVDMAVAVHEYCARREG